MAELETSITLMRMALALLDKAGEPVAAAYLQAAISSATREAPMQPGDEIPSELTDRFLGPMPD